MLSLELRAAVGVWRPGSGIGPALTIQAFGADVAPLSVPAPLIRVPEGTQVDVRVRNELHEPLRVFALCDRGAAMCAPLEVPGGETRQVRFASGPAGTYQYWATTTGMPQQVERPTTPSSLAPSSSIRRGPPRDAIASSSLRSGRAWRASN